jgi:hypothetical protein
VIDDATAAVRLLDAWREAASIDGGVAGGGQ